MSAAIIYYFIIQLSSERNDGVMKLLVSGQVIQMVLRWAAYLSDFSKRLLS